MSFSVCHLVQRGVLKIGGEDRRAFLQGMITNDINECADDKMLYAALLTPQGKFLHDMFIVDKGDHFLIDCEGGERAEDLLQRLRTHKLRSKVTFEDVSAQFGVWVKFGPHASAGAGFYADPRLPELGYRAILPAGQKPEGEVADFNTYDQHRIRLGVPDGSRDLIVGQSTLAEGNIDLLNGISWTKGCYMGQELTARIYHRGLVKKRLRPVAAEDGNFTLQLMPVDKAQ